MSTKNKPKDLKNYYKWLFLLAGIIFGLLINTILPVKIKQDRNIIYNNDKYKIEKINSDISYDFSVIVLYVKKIR